jgi:molecular chaperone Hsp33
MAEVTADGGSWLTRALVDDGAVRLVIVEAAEVADALREAHDLAPGSTRLAAEASLATLLLSAYAKGAEKLTLQLALEEPQGRYIGELDPEHRFRGRLDPATLTEVDPTALRGLLFVAKHDGEREIYRGITDLRRTSVTGALRTHLSDSSQVHGALATSVHLDDAGRVTVATGILAERLPPEPGKPSLGAEAFEARWGDLDGHDVRELLAETRRRRLLGAELHLLEQRPVFWGCTCSRGRVLDALAGLAAEELRAMADKDDGAAVDCHFCATTYRVDADELRALADASA